jgi:signal transduction histidine kinase
MSGTPRTPAHLQTARVSGGNPESPHAGSFVRYVLALAAVLVATLLTWLVWKSIAPQVSPLFFAAITLVAWRGGLGPALLATALAGFISIYFFSEPFLSLKMDLADLLRITVFVVVAVAVSVLADARRRAEEQLRAAHAGLEQRVAERTRELASLNETLQREIAEREAAERKLVEHQARLQDLASEVVLAEQRERRRLAERLHDDLGQILALSQIRLGGLREGADTARQAEELEAIEALVEQAVTRTRSITCELSPPVLYELGLEAAIQWLVEQFRGQSDTSADLRVRGDCASLSEEAQITLFQITRELLANVAKHARARNVAVGLCCEGGEASVVVEDDGVGLDAPANGVPAGSPTSFGLFSIRERLARHGGALHVDGQLGRGTRVVASLPVERARKAVR